LRLNKEKGSEKKERKRKEGERHEKSREKEKRRASPPTEKKLKRQTTGNAGVSEKLRENVVKRYKKIGMEWYRRGDESTRRGENLLP
jgi:hypothetical protein